MIKIICKIIDWIIDFFVGADEPDINKKEAESIINSHKEEDKAKKKVDEIKKEDSKVEVKPDGGISFDKFNKVPVWIFFILFISCTVNIPREPEIKYVVERLPVYIIVERPKLNDITGKELQNISVETKNKIVENYDKLIKWGEALDGILQSYNTYATNSNSQNILYKKQ